MSFVGATGAAGGVAVGVATGVFRGNAGRSGLGMGVIGAKEGTVSGALGAVICGGGGTSFGVVGADEIGAGCGGGAERSSDGRSLTELDDCDGPIGFGNGSAVGFSGDCVASSSWMACPIGEGISCARDGTVAQSAIRRTT